MSKASGPDNIRGHVLRDCAGELTNVFIDIFNIWLSQAAVPHVPQSHYHHPCPEEVVALLYQ